MQRILFTLVDDTGGSDAVAEVKRRAGLPDDRAYRIDTTYDDEEWRRLFAAALGVLEVSPEQAVEAYAEAFAKDALRRFRPWFAMSKNSLEFLKRQPAIHNSFSTALADPEARQAVRDKFRLHVNEDSIVTTYRSANMHCALYKTLARWIVRYYGDEATIREATCMHDGHPECEIHIRWTRLAG